MVLLDLSLNEVQSNFENLISVLAINSIVFEPVCVESQIIFSDRMGGDAFPSVDENL